MDENTLNRIVSRIKDEVVREVQLSESQGMTKVSDLKDQLKDVATFEPGKAWSISYDTSSSRIGIQQPPVGTPGEIGSKQPPVGTPGEIAWKISYSTSSDEIKLRRDD